MHLDVIIDYLKSCQSRGEYEAAFFLTRHRFMSDGARREDWGLVGPLPLEHRPRSLLAERKKLGGLANSLKSFSSGEEASFDCRQDHFLLIRELSLDDDITDESGREENPAEPEEEDDKDIWSVSQPRTLDLLMKPWILERVPA